MAGVDRDLLESPYGEYETARVPVVRVIAGLLLVIIATAFTLWLLLRSSSERPTASNGAASTTTQEPGQNVTLVAYQPVPPLLTHPTVLPRGWKACVLDEDRFRADRFCGIGDEEWVSVTYSRAGSANLATAVPAAIHDGMWLSQEDPLELRFPINEHVDLTLSTQGVSAEQALQIAESIPILGSIDGLYGVYEIPIDWEAVSDSDLVGLLDQFEDDAAVDLGRFELTVRTSNASLYGFNARNYWTPAAATDLPLARLVAADRPLVVGESDQLKRGYAVWDQAGFAWRLEGNLDAEEATALALSVIEKLRELPLDLSG